MKIAVISDVHGNLPALEAFLKAEKADMYVSLGDVVNYGPWQNECVELLNTLDYKILLRGNHEDYYLAGEYDSNGLSGRFLKFCFPQFYKMNLIKEYNHSVNINGYNFQHTYGGMIVYPDTKVEFRENYIIGHSHHQSFLESGTYKMYVVGSLGQNRQYINQIDYLVMNKGKIELKHITYDESVVINEMQAKGYPQEFIEYYAKKQRI